MAEYYRREHDLELRKPPDDTEKAIMQLWHAVIGTNGSGLVAQMKDLKDEMPNYVSLKECNAYHEGVDRKSRRTERILFACIALFGFLFGEQVITAIARLFA